MNASPSRAGDVLSIEQIRAFLAVAGAGSYQAASERLGHDRSSVYRLVRRLTASMGGEPLLHRDGHSLVLTSAGVEVRRRAQAVESALADLLSARPPIRFSAYPSIAAALARTANKFQRSKEGKDFDLRFSDISEGSRSDGGSALVNRLLSGELDIVVAPDHVDASLEPEFGYRWNLQAVLPERIRGADRLPKGDVTPEALAGFDLIVAPPGHTSRRLAEAAWLEWGQRFAPTMEISNQQVLRELARTSTSLVALLPSDAFGPSRTPLGPAVVRRDGAPLGGVYRVFHAPPLDADNPTSREEAVRVLARHFTSELNRLGGTDTSDASGEAL